MTTCILEFLTGQFDGPCRLMLDDEQFVEGTTAECVNALDRLIDPYADSFRMKTPEKEWAVVLRTPQQRAAGMSARVDWSH